jgi:hypothetical protein
VSNGLFGLGLPNINPPKPTDDDLPASAPRGARAAQILAAEQLAELRAMTQTLSSIAARLAGGVFNETLATATAQFDATGQFTLQFHVAAGSIRIRNLSVAGLVVVAAGGGQVTVPTIGPGIYRVPAGTSELVGMQTRTITVYGTAGDYVSYSAFTTGAAPNGS